MLKKILLIILLPIFLYGQWTDPRPRSIQLWHLNNTFFDSLGNLVQDSLELLSADGVTILNDGTFKQKVFADTTALKLASADSVGMTAVLKQLSVTNNSGYGYFRWQLTGYPDGYNTFAGIGGYWRRIVRTDSLTNEVISDTSDIVRSEFRSERKKELDSYYLATFSTATGGGGLAGRGHLAYSLDGITWTELADSIYAPLNVCGWTRYGNYWYLITAIGTITSDHFNLIRSKNLIDWEFVTSIYPKFTGINKAYAPKFFSDNGELYILAALARGSVDFNIYAMQALNEDLTEWSEPRMISGNFPNGVIDPYIIKVGTNYYLWYKVQQPANDLERMGYSVSTKPFSGYVHTAYMPSSYKTTAEGPVPVIVDSTNNIRLYFHQIDGSATITPYFTTTTDTFQTWSDSTKLITDITAGVPRSPNVIRVYNTLTSHKSPDSDFGGVVSKKVNTTIPQNPTEGNSYIKQGRSGKPDTMMVYYQGTYSKFPSSVNNPYDSLWTDDANTMLHVTFEGDTMTDSKGHTITLSGTHTYADGAWKNSTAGYFNGTDTRGVIADANAKDLYFSQDSVLAAAEADSNFTIAAVVKVEDFGGNASYSIASKGISWYLYIPSSIRSTSTFYGNSAAALGGQVDSLQWVLLTFVVDGDSTKTYVNSWLNDFGNSQNPRLKVFNDISNTVDLWIGGRSGQTAYWKGWIDELIIWKGARSHSDIIADYDRLLQKMGRP